MSVAVVTSCSVGGYERYGKRFIETFDQFWPADVDLYVVSEDYLQLPACERTVAFLHMPTEAPDAIINFYLRNAGKPAARGLGARPGRYNFRLDAWKFSKKVFALNLVASRIAKRRLIWLDADVVTFAVVPPHVPASLPPDGYAIACLDRAPYHSECGFVAYDLEHFATRNFLAEFQRLYVSDEVFALKEWHDSFVFDWLRAKLAVPSYKIPHKSKGHPFVHSMLGRYMDHLKGDRKQRGISIDHPHIGPKVPSVSRWFKGRPPPKKRLRK